MKCLTHNESVEWCVRHGYPVEHIEGKFLNPQLKIAAPTFRFVDFSHPKDSGRKVALSRLISSWFEKEQELLFWLGDWSVWPSSQHLPLFTRFRQALGEHRSLDDAPGHLFTSSEADDAMSVLVVSLEFFWDCQILSSSGRDAVFVSHDEFGWYASRDKSVADKIQKELAQNWSDILKATD